jgi:hypothetical protein
LSGFAVQSSIKPQNCDAAQKAQRTFFGAVATPLAHNHSIIHWSPAMSPSPLQIDLVFAPEDHAWMRRSGQPAPAFWQGHTLAPLVGDVLRINGRQFVIRARVWDHDDTVPHLRLFLSDAQAQSDTKFG